MRAKQIHDGDEPTFALVFDTGEEVIAGLTAFAEERGLDAARFTGLGAFEKATLGFFDLDRKDYAEIPVEQQVEVLSFVGVVALHEGAPKLHAHAVVGRADGSTLGGHVLAAWVRPTLEVVVVESSAHLRRRTDPETGLPLLDL